MSPLELIFSLQSMLKVNIELYFIIFLKLIIASLDSFGRTALDHAAYHGRFESLVELIEIGAQTE